MVISGMYTRDGEIRVNKTERQSHEYTLLGLVSDIRGCGGGVVHTTVGM